MGLDLRPDTTTLSPTLMRRNDIIVVPFLFRPEFNAASEYTNWHLQVRQKPDARTIAATWSIALGDIDAFLTDLSTEDAAKVTAAGVDNTWTLINITFDATGLEKKYAWDLQDETGNTIFGDDAMVVDPDVTRLT